MNESTTPSGVAAPCISLLADWRTRPHDRLRKFPNGTPFLLRLHSGAVHVCELCGNMQGDQSCKARRLTDGKIIRLENLQHAEFIVLTANTRLERAESSDDALQDLGRCEKCGGSGGISYNPNLNPNSFSGTATATCTRCGGTGIEDTANDGGHRQAPAKGDHE